MKWPVRLCGPLLGWLSNVTAFYWPDHFQHLLMCKQDVFIFHFLRIGLILSKVAYLIPLLSSWMGLELSTSYIFSLKHHSICASIYILTVQVIGLKSTIRNLPAIFRLLPTLCVKATFGSCASFIAIGATFARDVSFAFPIVALFAKLWGCGKCQLELRGEAGGMQLQALIAIFSCQSREIGILNEKATYWQNIPLPAS